MVTVTDSTTGRPQTRPLPIGREGGGGAPARLAVALFALAAGMITVAVLGPLVLGLIEYRYSESMLNQARGLDAFAAVVVAPVAVGAGVLSRRRHPTGPLLALGPAGFCLYMLVQYVIGPEYLIVDGNNERYFLLFVALFVLAAYVAVTAWSASADAPTSSRLDRRRGWMLVGFGVFVVAGMYLSNGFVSALHDFPGFVEARAATSEFDEHPTAYWIVAFLDLAVVVPLTVATGLGLVNHRRWARRAFHGILGWYALVPGSVAAMAVVMVINDDPAANRGRAVLFVVTAVVFLALAARSIRRESAGTMVTPDSRLR